MTEELLYEYAVIIFWMVVILVPSFYLYKHVTDYRSRAFAAFYVIIVGPPIFGYTTLEVLSLASAATAGLSPFLWQIGFTLILFIIPVILYFYIATLLFSSYYVGGFAAAIGAGADMLWPLYLVMLLIVGIPMAFGWQIAKN